MPKNHFKENRSKVQKAFIQRDFLIPLTIKDLPVQIVEKKHKAGDGKLRIVSINNIPATDAIRPISYLLELELEGELFSLPPKYKTTEKAVLLFCCDSLYVVLIEMKSSIDPPTIRQIDDKIKHSIGRILLFLTHYILDEPVFNDYKIKFFTLLLYNVDLLTKELRANTDPILETLDLVRVFQERQKSFFVTEPLGGNQKVDVIFKKNLANNEVFEIDFNEIFDGDIDYENAIYSEKTFQ